jgi:hypothetical protein
LIHGSEGPLAASKEVQEKSKTIPMAREIRNTAIYTAFDDYEPNEIPVPERSLLRAILVNAIADANRNDEHSRRARDYFLSKEDDYIFSFQAICSYLGIDPKNILILVGLHAGGQCQEPAEIVAEPEGKGPRGVDGISQT